MMEISNIELPSFIDGYIFKKLGATYLPDYTKFDKNLDHNKEDVLNYLGTYFPRSFAESYLIFHNIFSNNIIHNLFKEKEEINILDIGSGTGGNLSGFLQSFIDLNGANYNFNIIAVDGNKEALKILEKIIFKFQLEFKINISINTHIMA